MKVIFPNTFYDIPAEDTTPLFFLAGPIAGGGAWQTHVYDKLRAKMGGGPFYVASPATFEFADEVKGDKYRFKDQLEWEIFYFNLATQKGCVIFWLPEESKFCPRDDGLPYAMMTRDEIGRAREIKRANPEAQIVMGAEPGFPGLYPIQRYNDVVLGNGVLPIYSSIEKVINDAIILAG